MILSDRSWDDHSFQDHLKGHGVAASPAGLKKVAITGPLPIRVLYGMGVVGSVKGYGEAVEVNPIPLFGVAFGFLNFANHARVHGLYYSFQSL
jgi:hypothetical protein